MKRFVGRAALIAWIVLVTGCSSFFSRVGSDKQVELYPATNATMEAFGDLWCWMFLACPALIISLPVDVALDTLLLPVDTVRLLNRDDSEKKPETSAVPGVTEAS